MGYSEASQTSRTVCLHIWGLNIAHVKDSCSRAKNFHWLVNFANSTIYLKNLACPFDEIITGTKYQTGRSNY